MKTVRKVTRELEQNIGYTFKDKKLLNTALTHTSFANESKSAVKHNERLEFLGDAVLQIIAADYLFTSKNVSEGELTRMRASLVCEGALFKFSQKISLGKFMQLGKGEEASGGRQRPSIMADAFEALIAAIYLDGGIEAAREFVQPFLKAAMKSTFKDDDYKTKLQEIIQQNRTERLSYEVKDESGPDHNKHFVVEVYLNSNCIGTGEGNSKKTAEQAAAKEALSLMGF